MMDESKQETAEVSYKYTWIDVACVITSLISYIFDQGTDIWVAIYYFQHEKYWYFGLTLTFVIVPALTMTIFNLTWYVEDYKQKKSSHVSRLQWSFRAVCLLLQFGPIIRYFESLIYGIQSKKNKEKKNVFYFMMLYEDSDAGLLRLFECFMEAAPQLILQIYILFKNDIPENVDSPWKVGIQALSVVCSLVSLSWALAAYSRTLRFSIADKAKMTWSGTFLQFLWHFFYIISRVLALAMFASVYPYYIFVFCFLHWVFMTMWIYFQRTNFCQTRWQEFFYNVIMGIIHIFVFFNVKDAKTRWKYVAYYTLTFVQGSVLIGVCFIMSRLSFARYWPVLVGFYGAFILGITFMYIYYMFYHPNLVSGGAEQTDADQTDTSGPPHVFRTHSSRFTFKNAEVNNAQELVSMKT